MDATRPVCVLSEREELEARFKALHMILESQPSVKLRKRMETRLVIVLLRLARLDGCPSTLPAALRAAYVEQVRKIVSSGSPGALR